MYDHSSRLIVTHRIADDRIADARRENLLHTDETGYKAHDRLEPRHSLLGRVSAALRRSTSPAVTHHRPAYR